MAHLPKLLKKHASFACRELVSGCGDASGLFLMAWHNECSLLLAMKIARSGKENWTTVFETSTNGMSFTKMFLAIAHSSIPAVRALLYHGDYLPN